MDPLTCLAIAGNVVQFVDFGSKLILETHHIYHDGESQIRKRAAKATSDLKDFSTKFERTLGSTTDRRPLTEDEAALRILCANCKELADSLVDKLDTINVRGKHHLWSSVALAWANIWSKKDILATQEELDEYRRAIDTRIIGLTSTTINSLAIQQAERFTSLDRETQQILAGLADLKGSLQEELKMQTMAIAQLLTRQEVVIRSHTDEGTRVVINVNGDELTDSTLAGADSAALQVIRAEEIALREAVTTDILQSLHFDMISDRFDEVSDTHRQTFEWILKHPRDDPERRRWDDFIDWLEHGDGLYWVNGKAGSGKSTLLKLVCNHSDKKEHLAIWKGDMELHIAKFFFWSSGTGLQKSQIGLLRGLLHDILWKTPDLIPVLFPSQWAELYLRKLSLPRGGPGISWSLSILSRAFEALLNQTVVPMKFCFFVDGLDEYSGLGSDLARLFLTATRAKHVKVCVSSRPLPVFLQSFEHQPQLRLNDLTQGDIQQYVMNMLEQDERMSKRAIKEPILMSELVREIVNSAAGVFLWVKLIVMDLLGGLDNHDRISQLQQRLKMLPTDLEQLYEHMLFKVDSIYRVEASRFYQLLAATAQKNDDWMPAEPLDILTLALAEEDSDLVFNAKTKFLSVDDIQDRVAEIDVRLRSCCGGLLETQFGKSSLRQVEPRMKVSYIHRTVKDYLDSTGIRHVLSDRTGGTSAGSFNPHVALMRSYVLQLKLVDAVEVEVSSAKRLADCIITHARHAEGDLCEPNVRIMDAFFKAANTWWQSATEKSLLPEGESLITLAAQCGLHQLLHSKLSAEGLHPDQIGGRSLLEYAVYPDEAFQRFTPRALVSVSTSTVMVLLEHGSDPNIVLTGSSNSQSPWQNALTYLTKAPYHFLRESDTEALLRRWSGILKILLRYNADSAAVCKGPDKMERARDIAVISTDSNKVTRDERLNKLVIETRFGVTTALETIFRDFPELLKEVRRCLPKKSNPEASAKQSVIPKVQMGTTREGFTLPQQMNASMAARPPHPAINEDSDMYLSTVGEAVMPEQNKSTAAEKSRRKNFFSSERWGWR